MALHIQVIQVGKTKEQFFRDAEDEFLKRLSRYARINIETVDSDEKIIKRLWRDSFVIVLEIDGKQMSSEKFAKLIEDVSVKGKITFIIGGPHGLSSEIINDADLLLSFSKMTFTHQMIRIFLLEQIYRAFTIIEGKKYHY